MSNSNVFNTHTHIANILKMKCWPLSQNITIAYIYIDKTYSLIGLQLIKVIDARKEWNIYNYIIFQA